jgi:MFS family permease
MSSPSSWVTVAATRSTGLNDLLSWGLDPHTVAVVRHDAGVVALADGFRRPFARYWLSGFLADFGDGVRLAAFPLLAAQLTGSPGAVAAVTAVQGLPWLLVGAGLGVIVDRTDRRRLMLVVDITRAVIIAPLAAAVLAHGAGLVLIYLTAFVTGAGSALRDTAAVTCVPRLVEPANLDRANGRVIAGQIVGNELAGPAAGGWLFGLAAVLPFAVNAGTLGIAVLLLLTLPSVFQPVPVGPARRDRVSPLATLRHDLGEGARWLWQHPSIRDITIGAGVVSAMDAAWFAVLVLYVIQILHQKPGAYGLLLAVAALGGIATGGLGPRLTRRLGPWRSLLFAGLVMAATQAVLGLTASVIIAAVMLFASSAAWALFNLTAVTMRQRQVPAALLGRVSSLYGTVGAGAEVLGAIGGGALAATAGIRAPMLAGAIPIAGVITLLAWRHRAHDLPN